MSHDIDLMRRVEANYFPSGPQASTAKRVLLALAYFADLDGTNAFPSYARLAKQTMMGERTMRRGIQKLREDGVIEPTRSTRAMSIPSPYRPNQYRIRADRLVAPDSPSAIPDHNGGQDDRQDGHDDQSRPDSTDQSMATMATPGWSPWPPTKSTTNPTSSTHSCRSSVSVDDDERPETRNPHHGTSASTRDDEEVIEDEAVTDEGPLAFTADPEAVPESISEGARPAEAAGGDLPASQEPEVREYQDVDAKRSRHGWRPPEAAYDHARSIAPKVNLELLTTEYWLWCHEKSINPTSTHWMKWVTREQKRVEEAERAASLKESLEERRKRQWYAVAD